MGNIISLKTEKDNDTLPEDLITFSACAKKHNTSVSFLYKLFYKGVIKRYKRGYWKISESETKKAMDNFGG